MDKDKTPLHIDAEGGQDTPEIAPENKLAYFPLYLGVAGQPVIICGASKDSLAKIRLLLKTSAKITVYDTEFGAEYLRLATIKAIRLETNEPASDAIKAAVFGYIGYEDIQMRRRIRALFIAAGTPVCLIDDKDNSDFITPAIIDRAPVTIAIGSEGLAPVLVRHLKARIEAIVPLSAGRLAHDYAYDEIRISHEQNILLPHLPKQHLLAVWKGLQKIGLASANIGLASDIIACPGLDYCTLATARSIPIAQSLGVRFATRKREQDIGPLKIKISGCINACGHHHVGHIGILGLERAGVENYQITLGGDGGEDAALGNHTGPGFSAEELIQAIDRILDVYLAGRTSKQETFIRFYRRVGLPPFKAALYPGKTEAS